MGALDDHIKRQQTQTRVETEINAMKERASYFVETWASLLPAHRFTSVDGTAENALVAVRPHELVSLVAAAMAAASQED